MLIVDASALVEVLLKRPRAAAVRKWLAEDPDQAAPQIIDVEAFGVIRREHQHAMYVALAEALDAVLVTCDRRLAAAHGPRCEIVVPGLAQ